MSRDFTTTRASRFVQAILTIILFTFVTSIIGRDVVGTSFLSEPSGGRGTANMTAILDTLFPFSAMQRQIGATIGSADLKTSGPASFFPSGEVSGNEISGGSANISPMVAVTFWVDITPTIGGPGNDTFTVTGGTQTNQGGLTLGTDLFTTIQAAVTAASPGSIINVADGSYPEQVAVGKILTIRGNKFGVDARTRGVASETVVNAAGFGSAFSASVGDVIIDGFTVQGQTGGFPGTAIWMQPGTAGTKVRNNIIQNNVVGVYVSNNSAINQTVIEKNLFQNNTNTGAASGHGVYADQFTAGTGIQNILVDNNKFTNTAMVVDTWSLGISNTSLTPFTNITYSNNEVTNHGRGMYFYSTNGATVSNNSIAGTTNYAIGPFTNGGGDTNSNIDILNNTLTSNNRAVWVDGHSGPLDVHYNKITGSVTASIQDDDASVSVNASTNYWGTSSPATVAATIAGTNAGAVDFSPLIDNDESPANQAILGFTPDLSSVTVHTLGSQAGAGAVQEGVSTVSSGGTVNILTGTYAGNVSTAVNPVTLAPGASPGLVNITGDLTLDSDDTLALEINGLTAGTGFDKFAVSGTATVAGTLNLLGTLTPAAGNSFQIISAGTRTATFGSVPSSVNGGPVTVNYSGTDVTVNGTTTSPIITGSGGDDVFTVNISGGNLQIFQNGTLVFSAPIAGLTSVTIDGAAFNDALKIAGDGTTTAVYTPSPTTNGNGTVLLNGTFSIFFINFEPVDISGMATATVASPVNAANALALNAGFDSATGVTSPAIVVSGTTGVTPIEAAHLFNNTNVFIDTSATTGGAGSNTITDASAIPLGHLNTNITLKTNANGTVTFNADLLAAGAISIDTPTVNLNADITSVGKTTTAATTTFNVDDAPSGKIQDAIALATTGDTINVAAGTYNEDVDINKSVLLKSVSGAATTTIVGTGHCYPTSCPGGPKMVLTLSASGITLDGFTITTADPTINLIAADGQANSKNHVIKNNIITNPIFDDGNAGGGWGILLGTGDADNNQILNNDISLNPDREKNQYTFGIWAQGGGSDNNVVSGNKIHDLATAIIIDELDNNTDVLNNTFTNLARRGVVVFGSTNTEIINNVITNAGTAGVQVRLGATNTIVKSNDITLSGVAPITGQTPQGGVYVSDADGGTVAGVGLSFNRFIGNTPAGVNNIAPVSVNAQNNWWGCNYGPAATGAGCSVALTNGALGTVTTSPWIVLGTSASPNPIGPGGTSTVTSDMTQNSTPAPAAGGTVPLIPVNFTATNGTIAPTPGTITAGQATSLFTSTVNTSGTACSIVDSQTICTNITLTLPSFSIDDVTHFEGNGGPGTTNYVFTITKTGTTAFSENLNYATAPGTATSPSDFTAIPSTNVVFGPTDTTKQFTVLVNGDSTFEANEAFTVNLSNVSAGATISDSSGTGTITNDDVCGGPFATVYVDDSWVGTPIGDDPDGAGLATVFGCDSFATIQEGVNGVTSGGTVIVRAGTYPESVLVNKPVTLNGAQAGANANARFAAFIAGGPPNGPKADPLVESVITAAAVNPTNNVNNSIHVMADNVTIDGFVVDGNNPALPTGGAVVVGGINTDVRRGIETENAAGAFFAANAVLVKNNVIQNFAQRGVELVNPLNTSPATTGSLITGNLVRNFGITGVLLAFNACGDITSNTIITPDGADAGVMVQDFGNGASPAPTSVTIANNNITVGQDNAGGIWVNLAFIPTVGINNNTVNAAPGVTGTGGSFEHFGIRLTSIRPGTAASLSGNIVGSSGGQFAHGIGLWNNDSAATTAISGGSVSRSLNGLSLLDNDPDFGSNPSVTGANVSGITFFGNTVGAYANMSAPSTLTCNTFYNNATGISRDSLATGGLTATSNNIVGNGTGVQSTAGAPPVNAQSNYWGSANGSRSAPTNGLGDSVSANVDASSFLTAAAGCAPVVAYPTVTINQVGPDPTNSSPINFTATFSAAVTGFLPGDVKLSGTALPTTAVITGGPTSYNVAVSGMSLNGTVIAEIFSGAAANGAGLPSVASTSTDNTVTFDTLAPTVVSITRANANPTNAASVDFTVTFSEPVMNVGTTDFSLTTTGSIAGASVSTVASGPTTYTVSVNTGTGDGTIRLDIPVGATIQDLAGNPYVPPFTAGQVYTIDRSAPTVTINQKVLQPDPTNVSPIEFTATFSEAVTGFGGPGDVIFTGSTNAGPLTATVTGGPTIYNVAVTGMTGDGTVVVSIIAGAAIDVGGNPNSASTSTDNSVYFVTTCNNVSIPTGIQTLRNTQVTVPINIDDITGRGILGFHTVITYDSALLTYIGIVQTGTLSSGMNFIINSSTPGTLDIFAFGTVPPAGSGVLLNLTFFVNGAISAVPTPVSFSSFSLNEGVPCVNTTNGSVVIISGTITGTVTYANAPAPTPVPLTTLSATGSVNVSTSSAANGTYTLSGLGTGPYTVTPSKVGQSIATNNGISPLDASMIAQHGAGFITLNANQLIAADVTGNGTVSPLDAAFIAQWSAGIPNSGITGTWKFLPASRSYPNVDTNQTNQDYSGILMGDVTGNWSPTALGGNFAPPEPSRLRPSKDAIVVTAAKVDAEAGSSVIVPIGIQDLTDKGVLAYQFDLVYDPAVLEPQDVAAELAGTISDGMNVFSNAIEPGHLKVSVYGVAPVNGQGVLVNLRFTAIGGVGSRSPLELRGLILNEGGIEVSLIDGQVTIAESTQGRIRGRLLTPLGAGIANTRVGITSTKGEARSALSNSFGIFEFGGLMLGESYTVTASHKRYTFLPQTVAIVDGLTTLDMISEQ